MNGVVPTEQKNCSGIYFYQAAVPTGQWKVLSLT